MAGWKLHRIEHDTAGWGNRNRFTCYTCQETLMEQPYMGYGEWQKLVNEFLEKHSPVGTPCSQCHVLMNPAEAMLGKVCGKCCKENHARAVAGRF